MTFLKQYKKTQTVYNRADDFVFHTKNGSFFNSPAVSEWMKSIYHFYPNLTDNLSIKKALAAQQEQQTPTRRLDTCPNYHNLESVTFMSITAFVATTFSSVLATVIASWIIKKFMK